jgi:hypothetical protein
MAVVDENSPGEDKLKFKKGTHQVFPHFKVS